MLRASQTISKTRAVSIPLVGRRSLQSRPSRFFMARANGDGSPTGSIDDEPDNSSSDLNSRLQEEINRRKMKTPTPNDPFSNSDRRNAAPSWAGEGESIPQLEKSRKLNSEGLDGFIPRATELLKLATSLTLAFVPFAAVTALAFGSVYGVFGEFFVHYGSPTQKMPAYIDPNDLLSEDTYYPMVPVEPPLLIQDTEPKPLGFNY